MFTQTITSLTRKNQSKRSSRLRAAWKTTFRLESLEHREIPSIVPPALPLPDNAGSTMASARMVNVPLFQPQAVSDFLPNSADVDYYRVDLKAGDFLAANVHPTSLPTLNSTLSLRNSSNVVMQSSKAGTDPATGLFGPNPSVGFYAPYTGSYYLSLTGNPAGPATKTGYNLNLERVGINDVNVSASSLDKAGDFHAFLDQSKTILSVTGPTGYGFGLRGKWSTSLGAGNTVTYSAGGTVYLRTSQLLNSTGELALQVPSGKSLTISAHDAPAGWLQLGDLTSASGKLGLSLEPYAKAIENKIGVDLSNVAIGASWTIKTGDQVEQQYNGVTNARVDQVLKGVPYFVYGDTGSINMHFGQVSVTSGQSSLIMIADPADPFLYINHAGKGANVAFAGSLNGRIPFNNSVDLPSASGTTNIKIGQGGYYGHVFAAGSFPLKVGPLPISVAGAVTVNLDANGDGQFLGGVANASQLFNGDLNALQNVVSDINMGVNGTVSLGYAVQDINVSVPLGQASILYNGPKAGVAFYGAQGTALNTWKGTVLEKFECGPGTTVQGYIFGDGRFSVGTTSSYKLFTLSADATLTVANTGLSLTGTVHTPVGNAIVTGTIAPNGTMTATASAKIDIGNNNNYIRGNATGTLVISANRIQLDANVNAQAKLSLSGLRAIGSAAGSLHFDVGNVGPVHYAAGMVFSGSVQAWNPTANNFQGGWSTIGSASGGFSLSNGSNLHVALFGHTYSIGLPG